MKHFYKNLLHKVRHLHYLVQLMSRFPFRNIIHHRKELFDVIRLDFLDLCDLEFVFEILFNVPQLLLVVSHCLFRQFPHLAVKAELHDCVRHLHDKENPLFSTVSNQEKGENAYRT